MSHAAYNLDDDTDTHCECECETRAEHEAHREEAQREFLANPGTPPDGWSPERVARAKAAMVEARARMAP